jgi:hypothetical protein
MQRLLQCAFSATCVLSRSAKFAQIKIASDMMGDLFAVGGPMNARISRHASARTLSFAACALLATACVDEDGAPASAPAIAAPTTKQALVQTVNAAADSYVKSNTANTPQGTQTIVRVQDSGSNRGIVRFSQTDIANAVGANTLVQARVELTISANDSAWGATGRTLDLHRMTVAWTEAGATWNCAIDSSPSNNTANCSGATAWSMAAATFPWETTPASTVTVLNNCGAHRLMIA